MNSKLILPFYLKLGMVLLSLLISVMVTIATAGTGKVLLVAGTLFGIHLLDANLLLPMIVGAKVRLNGLMTILGVIAGGAIWGITGAFLAIPVATSGTKNSL